ncbi:MAG TPA: pyridoxal-phosphate dependent enzyme [Candidatus Binatia bacterium]|jgi:threonine synthase
MSAQYFPTRAGGAPRQSGDAAVALSDREILEAQALSGSLAGIFVEPAAATFVAAAKKLRDAGIIGGDDVVVCNLTGHGLKQPDAIHFTEKEFTPIAPTLEALRKRI